MDKDVQVNKKENECKKMNKVWSRVAVAVRTKKAGAATAA